MYKCVCGQDILGGKKTKNTLNRALTSQTNKMCLQTWPVYAVPVVPAVARVTCNLNNIRFTTHEWIW